MKDEKIVQYLFSSKKKKKVIGESFDDMQKYDARLLAFLSSDKVRDAVDMLLHCAEIIEPEPCFRWMQECTVDSF